MVDKEAIHELYERCKDINFDDTCDLLENAKSKEEKDFVRTVSNFILQQKQKQAIAEKRF
ncbi:MAG: hypothetical protein IKS18_08765 [Lachnospiraceae bacterium]|nr:hypothetical protein [Lachnospiraceae bacterium]